MPFDDSTLWQKAATGDEDAFGLLFERHASAIYNYCFRRVGDWGSAEDLVSIVFLEAWRRRETKLLPGKVLPWLYGIATNVVRNRRRTERRFAAALKRVPDPLPEPDFAENAVAHVDSERAMKETLAIISQLPRREQDVVVLCSWFDLSYEDAALALDVPVGTIRSRLSRARGRLRELGVGTGHKQGETSFVSKEAPND